MPNLIPPPGLRGIYVLTGPFATLLLPGVAYSCRSIRSVAELVNSGKDVYSTYYIPNGLDATAYATDVGLGMMIVTLQAGVGVWVDVPSTYIAALPDLNGVPYTPLVAALRLGAVPDETSLEYLQQRLVDVVMEELGVTSTCELVQIGQQTLVSQDDHDLAEASRTAAKSTADTVYAQFLEQKARADSLALRVTELEGIIIAAAPPTPPPGP